MHTLQQLSFLLMCGRGQKALNTFVAKENAYSATTVFPADVWAATKTDSPFSR
jgi:hypothetical protein